MRAGHFVLESGYHTDEWWDLESLTQRPVALMPYVQALAARMKEYGPEVVCGSLIEGAFIALLVASQLSCDFAYASRFPGETDELFPVSYRIPGALRPLVKGKRVLVVNDVISAGSAVRGTIEDLRQLGATILGVGSLFVLGEKFVEFCRQQNLPLIALFRQAQHLWEKRDCPLCAAGSVPLHLANS
jgi:orotate phosphoribosyltransferase